MEKAGNMSQRYTKVLYWAVTVIAACSLIDVLIYYPEKFKHPVSFATMLILKIGLWTTYFFAVREVRTLREQLSEDWVRRIESSLGVCCVIGYSMATMYG